METGDTVSRTFSKVVHSIKKTFHQVCQTNPLSKSEKQECNDQILPTRKRLSSEMPLEDNKKMKMEEGEEENPTLRWEPETVVKAVRQMAAKRRAALKEYKTVVEWTSSPAVVCAHVGPTLPPHMLRRYRSFLSEHNISLGSSDPSHLGPEDSEAGGSDDSARFYQPGKASNEGIMLVDLSSDDEGHHRRPPVEKRPMINCPICNKPFPDNEIEVHGNECALLTFRD